jgi:hypothetical protein
MAFTANSLNHDALRGTTGVQVNGYSLAADGIVEPDHSDPSSVVPGTKVSVVSNAVTALTGTSSSSGTAVTGSSASFDTELVVGSIISNLAGDEFREVTAIADADNLTIDSAFTTNLSAEAISKFDTVFHTSTVSKLASFQGFCYFASDLRQDAPLTAEPQIVSLEG